MLTRISHWAKRFEWVRYPVSTWEINFIFSSIHVFFCLLCKKIVLLPHKNRAVNCNAFHDNRHMWEVIMDNRITHVRLSILLVAKHQLNTLFHLVLFRQFTSLKCCNLWMNYNYLNNLLHFQRWPYRDYSDWVRPKSDKL